MHRHRRHADERQQHAGHEQPGLTASVTDPPGDPAAGGRRVQRGQDVDLGGRGERAAVAGLARRGQPHVARGVPGEVGVLQERRVGPGALRDRGAGVLLVSLDLAEILAVSDRVVVLSGGRIAGETTAADADLDELGVWMTGAERPVSREAVA